MKTKSYIIAICVSLVLAIFSFIRLKSATTLLSFESKLYGTIIGLSALVMLYIAYKVLLKRLSRGTIRREDYAVLYDLEKKAYTGEIEFYFTTEEPKQLKLSILDEKMQEIQVVKEDAFTSGGHIVRFDSTNLPNGVYFYCLEASNQKTMKKLYVYHDNLTA